MNYNQVTISAPKSEVDRYLGYHKKASYAIFNLHRLYPEDVPLENWTGLKSLDIEWYLKNTGSKSLLPYITVAECDNGQSTLLTYQTIWSPNNPLLKRLHEQSGWKIINEYESPDFGAEGTFTCEGGNCTNDMREYRPECDGCGKKYPAKNLTRQKLDLFCDKCVKGKTKSC